MSSPTTQAWGGAEDVAPVQLPHPVRMRVLGAVMVARLPVGARPDRRRHGAADDHHRPRRQRPLRVGHHGLPADGHDQRPAVRQDLRPVRPPAGVPVRHQRVHARLGARRPVAGDVAAGRRARHPGPRRRRDLPARDGDDRRPVLAVRARPLPGPVRRGVRALEPARPGHRRPDHRHHRLAVRVLRQHPDRPRGPVHDPALPAGLPPGRRQAEDRLPRRGAVHGRARADPHRPHQQAVGRLDRPHGGRPDRRSARSCSARSCGSSRGRPSRSCRWACSGPARSRSRWARCSWPCSGSSRRSCSCRAGSRSSAARPRRSPATRCCRCWAG